MGRHRRVVCEKCYRSMHSDHIARHMRKHDKYGEAGSLYGSVNSIASSTTSLNENMNQRVILAQSQVHLFTNHHHQIKRS